MKKKEQSHLLRLKKEKGKLNLCMSALSLKEILEEKEKETQFYNVFDIGIEENLKLENLQMLERKLKEGKFLITLHITLKETDFKPLVKKFLLFEYDLRSKTVQKRSMLPI